VVTLPSIVVTTELVIVVRPLTLVDDVVDVDDSDVNKVEEEELVVVEDVEREEEDDDVVGEDV
jgi:hypothetical protein